MFGHYREGRDIKKEMYEPVIYDLKELTDIEMMVPKDSKGQVIGFQIEVLPMTPEERKKTEIAEKKGVKAPDFRFQVECGSWETVIPEEKINDVRISIATTTFKKEDYITRNISILERELFYSDEPAKNHIRLRIIDNGRTLDPDEFNSEYIHVYPNENVGGAGGFTRGILESISAEDFKATHVLLMDDDVMVLPESFIRTYSLLALVKPQYSERYVSGAMLYFEQMNLRTKTLAMYTMMALRVRTSGLWKCTAGIVSLKMMKMSISMQIPTLDGGTAAFQSRKLTAVICLCRCSFVAMT